MCWSIKTLQDAHQAILQPNIPTEECLSVDFEGAEGAALDYFFDQFCARNSGLRVLDIQAGKLTDLVVELLFELGNLEELSIGERVEMTHHQTEAIFRLPKVTRLFIGPRFTYTAAMRAELE